jgi:tetratricopeptide (TPR) repeat protein
MHRSTVIFVAFLAVSSAAAAQHEQHSDAAGEKLGTVHFDTSCKAEVHGDFDRAVALLHSFEFRPAAEAFNGVLGRDPSCAIAYWGIALCHWSNPFGGIKSGPLLERGLEAAQKGLATGSPTPRERAYIEAALQLFKDAATRPHRDRTLAYEKAMEQVQRDFPKDTEARIFYALAVSQTALPSDKTYANQLKAGGILEPLFKQYPDHPGLAHYIIHAYDVPALAPKALDAARRYATIAPSAPHALHMPSHTFTRVGYWRESIDTNRASEQTALKQGVIGEALHAMDYQTYAYLQTGQDKNAAAVLQRMPAVLAKLDPNAMGGAASGFAGAFASAAMVARYALERGAWSGAASLQPRTSAFPQVDAITHFARALGAARRGKPGFAKADIERLAALRDKLTEMRDAYWAEQVDIQRRVAEAWVSFAYKRQAEGIQMLRAAADAEDATDKSAVTPGPLAPARELLGEMLLEAGNAKAALVEFEATTKKEPGRFRGAYGAARAAEAAGDRATAGRYYRQLLEIAQSADTDRPELRRAREFVEKRRTE